MDNKCQFIYFEKQGQDRMCGLHCINALLQGPYFDEVQMSQIAWELDEKEKNLMMKSGTQSKDYLKFMQQESNNVADDGNYSIQVLSEALMKFNQITCYPMENAEIKKSIQDFSQENAYICHSVDHWIAI